MAYPQGRHVTGLISSTSPQALFQRAAIPANISKCARTICELDAKEPIRSASVRRKHAFLAGREAASACLCGLGHVAVEIVSDQDGVPIWPTGFVGSISHTDGIAVAAAARANDFMAIGIDLEEVRLSRRDRIETLIADREEQNWIAGDMTRTIQVFSAKEAVYKALYPLHRRYFGFEAVQLKPTNLGFDAELREQIGPLNIGDKIPVVCTHHNGLVLSLGIVSGNRTGCGSICRHSLCS